MVSAQSFHTQGYLSLIFTYQPIAKPLIMRVKIIRLIPLHLHQLIDPRVALHNLAIPRQESINGKCPSLTLIICAKYNEDILDRDHQRQRP